MKAIEMMNGGRRSFLRGAGALLALPFLESAPALLAAGADSSGTDAAEPKKRLVCLGVALSMYPGEWLLLKQDSTMSHQS